MGKEKTINESFGKLLAILIIIFAGFAIIKWKEYETKMIAESKIVSKESVITKVDLPLETIKRIETLEYMATKEREKIRVMVEHDGSPLTSTYPMILDATKSFDPDVEDEIEFVWRQVDGPKVVLKPNPFAKKVSFEGESGEYTFELRVSDNYGSESIITKTVVIEPEPNAAPIIDLSIRQGSELN